MYCCILYSELLPVDVIIITSHLRMRVNYGRGVVYAVYTKCGISSSVCTALIDSSAIIAAWFLRWLVPPELNPLR